MKKLLSIFASVALCLSVIVPLTLSAATDPIKAHLLVSDITVGQPVTLHNNGGTTTFTGTDSIVNYDDHAAMKVSNSTKAITEITAAEEAGFDFNNVTLNGEAFLIYVKVPDNNKTVLVRPILGTEDNANWPRGRVGEPYQLLADSDDEWQDETFDHCPTWQPTDPDGVIVLPSGFAGHVRIPFTSIYNTSTKSDIPTKTTRLSRLGLRFTNYGGDLGDIVVGPIMIDENQATTTTISIDGAAAKAMRQPVPVAPTVSGLKIEQLSSYTKMTVGDDATKTPYASTDNNKNMVLKAIPSQVGYTTDPAIEVDNVNKVDVADDKVDASGDYFYARIYKPLSDSTDVMFYVKMPNVANKLFLVVETNTDGSMDPSSWPRIERNAKYSLLKKGETSWSEKTAEPVDANNDANNDASLDFEAGFEGYVKIPLSSITWKASNNLVVDSSYSITRLLFRYSAFGGDNGKIITGPFFKITDFQNESKAFIDGSKDQKDLFSASTYDANKPLVNFQTISDSHVDDYGGGALSIGANNMIAALSDIKTNHADTNAILHGGDITESGQANQYAQAYGYFESYSPTKNIIATIGNHDIRGDLSKDTNVSYEDMLARFQVQNKKYFDTDKPYYDTWINGYHFIVLATDTKQRDSEDLSDEQLTWFMSKAAENASPTKPIFVLTHDCVAGTFSSNTGDIILQSDDVKDVMNKYPQIVLFTGHLHSTDIDNSIISEGHGIFVDMPSLHNSNRPLHPNDEYNHMYYNVSAFQDRVEINLYDFNLKKNVKTFTINTADFGKTSGDEPGEAADKVLKAKVMDSLSEFNVGDKIVNPGYADIHNAASEKGVITASAAEPLNKLTNKNTLKIDSTSKIIRHGIADQSQIDIGFGPGGNDKQKPVSLKKGKAFLMYVKMPSGMTNEEIGDADDTMQDYKDGKNLLFFNVQNVNLDGSNMHWASIPEGSVVKYLEKGTNKWQTVVLKSAGEVILPAGFEGYVYCPFADCTRDGPFDETNCIEHFGVSVGYFGGDYGAFYMNPILLATNDVLSKDGVQLDGSDKVSNLFTGDEMTVDAVYEDPNAAPEVGSQVTALPTGTQDIHNITSADVNSTGTDKVTVTLKWEAVEGATKYRIDTYTVQASDSGITYTVAGNKIVEGTTCDIPDLSTKEQYYFVVTALDKNGAPLVTFNPATFLQSGNTVPELPVADSNASINDINPEDITNTSVKVSWEPTDGASEYQVEVYISSYGSAGLQYIYAGGNTVTDTTCTITGLKPASNYFVVVKALNDKGDIIATYEAKSFFTTSDESGDNTGEGNEPGDVVIPGDITNGGDNSYGDGDIAKTGVQTTMLIVVSIMFVLSLGAVYFLRKKRSDVQ